MLVFLEYLAYILNEWSLTWCFLLTKHKSIFGTLITWIVKFLCNKYRLPLFTVILTVGSYQVITKFKKSITGYQAYYFIKDRTIFFNDWLGIKLRAFIQSSNDKKIFSAPQHFPAGITQLLVCFALLQVCFTHYALLWKTRFCRTYKESVCNKVVSKLVVLQVTFHTFPVVLNFSSCVDQEL